MKALLFILALILPAFADSTDVYRISGTITRDDYVAGVINIGYPDAQYNIGVINVDNPAVFELQFAFDHYEGILYITDPKYTLVGAHFELQCAWQENK